MSPDEALLRLGEIARSMGKAPAAPPRPSPPPGMLVCACQKKMIPLTEVQPCISPKIGEVLDPLCAECRKLTQKMALIVCAGCRVVVTRIEPHRDRSGFTFEPGEIYHTSSCPFCKKGTEVSKLVEKELFDRARFGR